MENFDFTKTPEDKEIDRNFFEEKYKEEERYKLEIEIEVKKAVRILTKRFIDKIGISLEEDDYPRAIFQPNIRAPWGTRKSGLSTCHCDGVITITENNLDNKDAFAEEISHFIRFKLRPVEEEKDPNVEEFFGYLGRKILFPNIERKLDLVSGQEYEDYKEKLSQRLVDKNLDIKEKSKIEKELSDTSNHYYGYKYASLVSIENIKDWQKLFSMSNSEVRKEFFVAESQDS